MTIIQFESPMKDYWTSQSNIFINKSPKDLLGGGRTILERLRSSPSYLRWVDKSPWMMKFLKYVGKRSCNPFLIRFCRECGAKNIAVALPLLASGKLKKEFQTWGSKTQSSFHVLKVIRFYLVGVITRGTICPKGCMHKSNWIGELRGDLFWVTKQAVVAILPAS